MAKRGLGAPKAAHVAAGKKAFQAAYDFAKAAVVDAKDGRCRSARVALGNMHENIGKGIAHREAGGFGVTPAAEAVEAMDAFDAHCIVPGALKGLRGGSETNKRKFPPPIAPGKPPPVYHERRGLPPGVPAIPGLKGKRRR